MEIQGPNGQSSVTYNLFDDATGAELGSDNGDLDDVTFTYSATAGGANSAPNRPRWVIRNPGGTYQLTGQSGYTGTVPANNPGTRQSYTIEAVFADHLTVDSVTLDTSSLNTAGTTWEFSVVTFLDTNGNPFSSVPVIPAYLSYGAGFTGSSGVGHYIAASTLSVLGVGGAATSNGVSGPADSAFVDISTGDVTIPAGQAIGGFILTTALEDVRGTTNGASSSVRRFVSLRSQGLSRWPPKTLTFPSRSQARSRTPIRSPTRST